MRWRRRTRKPSYAGFDVLWLNGNDLRCLPLSDRRQRLLDILPKGSRFITEALAVQGRGRELFELMRAHDLEGKMNSSITQESLPLAKETSVGSGSVRDMLKPLQLAARGRLARRRWHTALIPQCFFNVDGSRAPEKGSGRIGGWRIESSTMPLSCRRRIPSAC